MPSILDAKHDRRPRDPRERKGPGKNVAPKHNTNPL